MNVSPTAQKRRAFLPAALSLALIAITGMAYGDTVPDGYQAASDAILKQLSEGKDQPHDRLVADAARYYLDKKFSCQVVVAKPPKGKAQTTSDLIVTCKSEQCKDGWVVFVEVKAGQPGSPKKEVGDLDKAVDQLDKAAKAALDNKLITKPTKDTLNKCYHSVILVPTGKTLKDAGKLKPHDHDVNPNWTKIGSDDMRWQPEVKDKVADLPHP